jgi:hypothetical protein
MQDAGDPHDASQLLDPLAQLLLVALPSAQIPDRALNEIRNPARLGVTAQSADHLDGTLGAIAGKQAQALPLHATCSEQRLQGCGKADAIGFADQLAERAPEQGLRIFSEKGPYLPVRLQDRPACGIDD